MKPGPHVRNANHLTIQSTRPLVQYTKPTSSKYVFHLVCLMSNVIAYFPTAPVVDDKSDRKLAFKNFLKIHYCTCKMTNT